MDSQLPTDRSAKSSSGSTGLSKKTKVWERTFIEKTILGPGGIHSRKRLQISPDLVRTYVEGEPEDPTPPPDKGRYAIGYWKRLIAAIKKYGFGDA